MVDERSSILQKHLTREMLGIEIGAFYNPVVAKRDGWKVVNVDHATKEDLLKFYAADVLATPESVQEVDVVWNGGVLSDSLQRAGHHPGTFKYILASHVIEHFPDMLGTLIDFERVLDDRGWLSLAVPDFRYCFDFFMPWSSTAEVLAAHDERRTRHTKASFFRMAAYNVVGIFNTVDRNHFVKADKIGFASDLRHAYDRFLTHDASAEADYVDNHTWYFTPSSFALVMLELRALNLISFNLISSERGPHGEFLVSLQKSGVPLKLDRETLNRQRMYLLKKSVREIAHRADMLDGQQGIRT